MTVVYLSFVDESMWSKGKQARTIELLQGRCKEKGVSVTFVTEKPESGKYSTVYVGAASILKAYGADENLSKQDYSDGVAYADTDMGLFGDKDYVMPQELNAIAKQINQLTELELTDSGQPLTVEYAHRTEDMTVVIRNDAVVYGYPNISSSYSYLSDYYGYVQCNEIFIDAEKGQRDDSLCWAAAAANTLYYTGWLTTRTKTEDDVFLCFREGFQQNGGSFSVFGYEWFLNDCNSIPNGLDQPLSFGGFFSSSTQNVNYYQFSNSINNFPEILPYAINRLQEGKSITLGFSYYDSDMKPHGGHAVTMWGYTYNSNEPVGTSNYYTGIIISDSDDNKGLLEPTFAPDVLKIWDIQWDSSRGYYRILPQYTFGEYHYIAFLNFISILSPAPFATLSSGGSVSSSAATLLNKTVESGYIMNVSSAGLAMDTTVTNGGVQTVLANGTALDTIVSSGGSMTISSGGTALFSSDGYADNIQAASGAILGLTVAPNTYLRGSYGLNQFEVSSNSISGYTVHSGCTLDVLSGGTAADITTVVAGGKLNVSSGGTATNIVASEGALLGIAVAPNTTVHGSYGNVEFNMSNAGISNYTVQSGCKLDVLSGGTAIGITASSGAHLGIAVAPNTSAQGVYDDSSFNMTAASISNYTIYSGCSLDVLSGGTVNSAFVSSGGIFNVSSGAVVSGDIKLGGTMIVCDIANGSGAIVDYLVKDRTPRESAMLINPGDLTSASFRVTVSGNDEFGFYNLAKDVPGNYSVNIGLYKSTENIGTLSVGGTVSNAYRLYLLRETNGIMYLNIAEKPIKTDINHSRKSDVIFYEESGEHRLGYWLDGTNSWLGQSPLSSGWDVLGGYDMNSDGYADLVATMKGTSFVEIRYFCSGTVSPGANNYTSIGSRSQASLTEWNVKVGNLTGNIGKNSIVWHNTSSGILDVWKDGTTSSIQLGTYATSSGWAMQGCGDFDGDGKDEVLMTLNGSDFRAVDLTGSTGVETMLGTANWTGWDVRAIGDFSGDGKDDIILFYQESGSMVKLIDGSATNYESIGQLSAYDENHNPDWSIVGCGDYNGDGKDDLLVKQSSTTTLGYYSEGIQDTDHWHGMGNGVGSSWTVIA